ncbi:hypothetical protein HXX51_17575 [Klebsiella pneumoniae]|uniref:hypothetical protein n=1 Tax=Klebsiella pneumoniae complex TaxID=3390273 RepID=UPI000FEBD025|nr:hypothetical protein [Klebsiella pneumoniae]MBP3104870.1 hypothetical protein [Klebsiella pneumoniae]MBP3110703.1 hypothetical protein [Klebsiella pneumoniae]MBP3122238.1 hypothetical protein [Klebsiella pneumoniae]MBP3150496.1 hypothetical protein [Klebsiella pneumoniae]MBP3158537.1 hypothetical protein [Klebsiella pneumoniae]
MSKSFPEWWKHGQKVRTANDGVLTLNIAEDSEYWLTNNAGKEVSVFSMDILGPASVPEACGMTTDITELAMREKFEAWWEREYKHLESSKYTDAVPHIKYGFWMAYQAGGAELVEALEKAQQRISELENYAEAEAVGADRAAEDSVYWMKRCKELESRVVTVKLTDINEYLAEVHDKTLNRAFRLLAEGVRAGDVAAMRAAGIKVEAE